MIQHNQLHFMHAKDSDKEEILALYHSLVGTEYCAWTQEYPGEKEFAYDMGRDALFCLKNDKGEIVGTITIDQDPEVEALSCWSKDRQPSAELSRLGVRVDYQNQGIARILLSHGMQELKRQQKKSVHFLVCKTNQKLAFRVVGECRLFDVEWWCYEKEL